MAHYLLPLSSQLFCLGPLGNFNIYKSRSHANFLLSFNMDLFTSDPFQNHIHNTMQLFPPLELDLFTSSRKIHRTEFSAWDSHMYLQFQLIYFKLGHSRVFRTRDGMKKLTLILSNINHIKKIWYNYFFYILKLVS